MRVFIYKRINKSFFVALCDCVFLNPDNPAQQNMTLKRKFVLSSLILIIIAFITIVVCDRIISKAAEGKLYNDVETIPYRKVGLLLGTSRTLANGNINPYYWYRVQAAAELIKKGKIKYLIISGDNGRKDYNEPEAMKMDLSGMGIDTSVIYLDYAGFRTFDSIVRLKDIFSQDSVTIISQPFHNERAIYIASREGIDAIGYNARDVSKKFGFRIMLREKFARVKVFWDYLFGTKPKFLGQKIFIP